MTKRHSVFAEITVKAYLALAVCFGLAMCRVAAAQTLEVAPQRVLVDEAAVIRASGLQPDERVTIRAELVDGADDSWESEADFVADAQGMIDVSNQAPVAGSYKEISAMGLVWSMRPKDKSAKIYRPPKEFAPQAIEFRLVRHGQEIAKAKLEQTSIAENVKQVVVRGTLHGVLFEPAAGGPYPGVLVVGGSNGGVPRQLAAWLASRGFAAFALAYFRYEDLPAKLEAIPLEYFSAALSWMGKRPEIAADHIGVLGVSRGGELALQLGSMYREIKAVVAFVPANVRYGACCGGNSEPYAWTWNRAPLAYVNVRALRNPDAVRAAAIPVENTQGPVLMISGQDDGVWESSRMADEVVARLKAAHFPYRFEHLKYRHAGHGAGHPAIVPAWHGRIVHPVSGAEVDLGGTPEGNAQSSLDAIPKVLQFLRENLSSSTSAQPAPGGTPTH
jgi:dienelactone hydrolase